MANNSSNYSTFPFIESGIILNTRHVDDLKAHNFSSDDFRVFRDAYKFLIEYYDTYGEFPTLEILYDKFEDLDEDAEGGNLQFLIKQFNDNNIALKAQEIIREEGKSFHNEPRMAVSNIISRLERISQKHDEEVFIYDEEDNVESRIDEFNNRRELLQRNNGMKLLGIPTPLSTINATGLGVQPTEICSMVARPGVGKSWWSVRVATLTAHRGYKTMLVTAEMPSKQIALRLDTFLGKMEGYEFSHNALKTGGEGINVDEYKQFLQGNRKRNLMVVDKIGDFGISVRGIATLVRQHRPQVLVIDNMELVTPEGGNNSNNRATWERMLESYYLLKHLAIANNVAIFTTLQASRLASDPFKPPGNTEIATGDALLRASDMVFSMCHVRDEPMQRLIAIQKLRDVPDNMEHCYMAFDVDSGVFDQIL